MSGSASMVEPGPPYSLFAEVACAVGATILALYLCQGRKKKTKPERIDVPVEEQPCSSNEKAAMEAPTEVRNEEVYQQNKNEQANTFSMPEQNQVVRKTQSRSVEKECFVKATQTEGRGDELMDEERDLRILWKAVVVNCDDNPSRRYRTELRVDVDGVITHQESFKRNGIAGVGMHQVLVKVQ